MDVKGRNLLDGLPKNIEITSEEVREALSDPVNQILDAVRSTLEKTPPELSADIIDRGIMLTGGGALLRGLDKLISIETKIPVHVAENPLDCVVDGCGVCLRATLWALPPKRITTDKKAGGIVFRPQILTVTGVRYEEIFLRVRLLKYCLRSRLYCLLPLLPRLLPQTAQHPFQR